jgi:DNA repair protein RadA/Sms
MEKKLKTAYVCTRCGAIHPKWQGQCRECNEWNTLAEEALPTSTRKAKKSTSEKPQLLRTVLFDNAEGYQCGIPEFDRVLGGRLLPGSSILLAGEPGIGKSTLILQVAEAYSQKGLNVLYVTGEESAGQMRTRADRLNVSGDNISVANLNDLHQILSLMESDEYRIVIIDSIQTVASDMFDSPPGTIGQIRESAGRLIELSKKNNLSIFLIGHVTKEGMVAGPKVLEHMVDAVLYFEGDNQHFYRLLRPVKNRYGSTFELGVFEMMPGGLIPVDNPSTFFLSDHGAGARTGSVVAASCEGNRPILVEIQALVASASYGTPQRVAGGIENKRLALLLAILEKRAGMPMGANDVFVSVAGGLRLSEPSVDLAVVTAIVSSLRDLSVDSEIVIAGEVGLSGEVRAVGMIERRIGEAAKLGFKRMVLPAQNIKGITDNKIELLGACTLEQAFNLIF